MLEQDLLKELFDYKDGDLIWKENRGSKKVKGEVAGNLNNGYLTITINKERYKAHRLVYLYHYGSIDESLSIDHINGVRNDNRIENLRLVTTQENGFNIPSAKGYSWNKRTGKWKARIILNKQEKHLGYFDKEEDARGTYLEAKEKYHIIKERV